MTPEDEAEWRDQRSFDDTWLEELEKSHNIYIRKLEEAQKEIRELKQQITDLHTLLDRINQ